MRKEKIFILLTLGQLFIFSFLYILFSEYIIRNHVIPIDNNTKTFSIFKKSKSPNVIWGDSQTRDGINNLSGFVNLSFGGDTYQEIELKMKHYYKRIKDKKDKKAIILLGFNSFGELNNRKNRPVINEMFLSEDKKLDFYMSKKYYQRRAPGYIKNFLKNKFAIFPNKNAIVNKDGSLSTKVFYKSLEHNNIIDQKLKNSNLKKNNRLTIIEGLIEDSNYNLNYLNSPNYAALIRIIDYLKNEKIKTCYITTPRHKDYRLSMAEYPSFNDLKILFERLSYKKNITYFDFSEFDYPARYYADPKHLNQEGAKEFTKVIDKYCFPNS